MIWTWCLDCSESLRYMLSSQAQQNQGQNQANLQNHRTHESRFYLVVIGLLAHHLLVWSQSKLPNSKMFGFQCSLWPCVESRRKLLKSIYSVNVQRLIIFTKLPYLLRPNRRKKRNEQTFNAKQISKTMDSKLTSDEHWIAFVPTQFILLTVGATSHEVQADKRQKQTTKQLGKCRGPTDNGGTPVLGIIQHGQSTGATYRCFMYCFLLNRSKQSYLKA